VWIRQFLDPWDGFPNKSYILVICEFNSHRVYSDPFITLRYINGQGSSYQEKKDENIHLRSTFVSSFYTHLVCKGKVMNDLKWKKYPVLNDGFVCLVDNMGDDRSIVQAARVSYGKDRREDEYGAVLRAAQEVLSAGVNKYEYNFSRGYASYSVDVSEQDYHLYDNDMQHNILIKRIEQRAREIQKETKTKDRALIRYLMSHYHTTPFEMVEFKFLVRVPMDCWRQWIRHRTASVNEYSTRYTEAIDSQQTTPPQEWRLQATDNKQGSSGYLNERSRTRLNFKG
jgi:thymidylate synthase ThyX